MWGQLLLSLYRSFKITDLAAFNKMPEGAPALNGSVQVGHAVVKHCGLTPVAGVSGESGAMAC
jgi:hypothetical protein